MAIDHYTNQAVLIAVTGADATIALLACRGCLEHGAFNGSADGIRELLRVGTNVPRAPGLHLWRGSIDIVELAPEDEAGVYDVQWDGIWFEPNQEELREFGLPLRLYFEDAEAPACRVCGCTEAHPCLGGCYWIEPDLC